MYNILNFQDGYMIDYQLSTGVCWGKDEKSDSGGVENIRRSQSFGGNKREVVRRYPPYWKYVERAKKSHVRLWNSVYVRISV